MVRAMLIDEFKADYPIRYNPDLRDNNFKIVSHLPWIHQQLQAKSQGAE
jgi:hypothetical protein